MKASFDLMEELTLDITEWRKRNFIIDPNNWIKGFSVVSWIISVDLNLSYIFLLPFGLTLAFSWCLLYEPWISWFSSFTCILFRFCLHIRLAINCILIWCRLSPIQVRALLLVKTGSDELSQVVTLLSWLNRISMAL